MMSTEETKEIGLEMMTRNALTRRVATSEFSAMISKNNVESVIQTMNKSLNSSISSSGKRNLHMLKLTWKVVEAVGLVENAEWMRNQFRLLRGTMCHENSFQNALKLCATNLKTESSKMAYLKIVKDLSVSEKALACSAMSFELTKNASYRAELLKLFDECAIDSYASLENESFRPFENILRTIDHADFVKHVEPVIRIAFSKSHYGLIENIVSSVTIDLSRYLEKLFIPGLGNCLSYDVEEKTNIEASIGIARVLYPRCSDIDSLCSSLNVLTEKVKSSFVLRYGTDKMMSSKTTKSSSSSSEKKKNVKKETKKKKTTSKTKKNTKKGFGFSKDKKKKSTSSKKTIKQDEDDKKKVSATVTTTTTKESSTNDKESHIIAHVYIEYLLAAHTTLKKLGNVAKDTMHDSSLRVVTFLTQLGRLVICVPLQYAVVLSEYTSLAGTMHDSGVKMLSKLLESGDLNTMTMSAHVISKCFHNTEVARKNGTQLRDILLTTFRSLVDPKHIVKSKTESSCLICLSLALLRLASASVSDEEIIRKEPETRNLWKLLSVSMEKKSRLFINASPLLFSENIDAFESWQISSVKKMELNRNVESAGICDLLSTCARSYASLLVLSEDCTQWIVSSCVAMLFDPSREIRIKACDSIQQTYRSLGTDVANAFFSKILNSMKAILDNLQILDTKARANRKRKEDDALKFRRSVGEMVTENDEDEFENKKKHKISSCPQHAWIAHSLRSIVPSKPSASLLTSLLLLTYHPRVNVVRRKEHTHPSYLGSNYFQVKRRASRNLKWLSKVLPEILENDEIVIKTLMDMMWRENVESNVAVQTSLSVFSDLVFVLSDLNVKKFASRAVCELLEGYQDICSISEYDRRIYSDRTFRYREILEIESLVSVEGRPNKGTPASKQYEHENEKWRLQVQAVIDEAPLNKDKVRDEKNKKKAPSKSSAQRQHEKNVETLRQELEQNHTNTIEHVSRLLFRVQRASRVLLDVGRARSVVLQSQVSSLVPVLGDLVRVPLCRDIVLRLLASLAAVTESATRTGSFARSFLSAFLEEEQEELQEERKNRLDVLISDLKSKCGKPPKPVSCATMHLCMPLLRAALACDKSDGSLHPAAQNALTILAVHAVIPKSATSDHRALLHRMILIALKFVHIACDNDIQGLAPPPSRVLVATCAGPTPTLQEIRPLLEDEVGLFSTSDAEIRRAILSALAIVARKADKKSDVYKSLTSSNVLRSALWVSRFDEDEKNAKLGTALWSLFSGKIDSNVLMKMSKHLCSSNISIRDMTAKAVAAALLQIPDATSKLTQDLIKTYHDSLEERRKLIDELAGSDDFKRVGFDRAEAVERRERAVKQANETTWFARDGVAKAFFQCAKSSVPSLAHTLSEVLPFIVTKCLFDPIDAVREMFVEAGCEIVNQYGKEKMNTLMPILQRSFDDDENDVDKIARDKQFAGVILMLSLLATHAENSKTSKILDTMILALRTPSELVQKAVAKHLPALIRKAPENADSIVNTLMKQLFEQSPATYGSRRGGAFGLAGVVKGLRIGSLKKYNILDELVKGIEDIKGPWEIREGALMALEVMFSVLGMIFEPYAIGNLPILLGAVSDRKREVQLAAQDAAKAMMKNLSEHGVKQVLPKLIPSLQERKWQTKMASIKMLGAMAYAAPKTLSSSLPKLVPHLIDASGSTHTLVQRAAHSALKDIGHVIRNPEIQALVPTLIKALTRPVECTLPALETLTQTAFVHSVDAPSLALIVPILERALRGRDGEIKKRAALIFGSMGKLIGSSSDIEPYMPLLMPQLRAVVVDPIPDIRAVAAKALGSLFESLGETYFPDIINWLITTLYSDESVGTVERRGAAQSLAAVMSKLSETRNRELLLEKLLPAIQHASACVREGVLWLLNFLPTAVKSETFVPLLGDILPCVVAGLGDDAESVRDTALKAGRVVVEQYAETSSAIDQILPVLERGMFLADHRMRVSSVQLLGDMLYKIGDTRAVHTDGEDDTHGTQEVALRIAKTLGSTERRDRLLAALYITRSDTSVSVRHAAKVVWKTIVPNTGRVLREILSDVIQRLLVLLRANSEVAGRCLGDLVSKLGERVVPSVLPILEKSFEENDAGRRRAVCMCVREIVANAHKKIIEDFSDQMLSLILSAICDVESEVRESAAQAFNRLQIKCGQEIVGRVIPHIVNELGQGEEKRKVALDGLRGILKLRGEEVMPLLISKLLGRRDEFEPLTIVQVEAFRAAANVDGSKKWMHRFLKDIIPIFLDHLRVAAGSEEQKEGKSNSWDDDLVASVDLIRDTAGDLVCAVDALNMRRLTDVLGVGFKHDNATVRAETASMAANFIRTTDVEFKDLLPHFLKEALLLYVNLDNAVLVAAMDMLLALEKRFGKEELAEHIDFVRQTILNSVSFLKHSSKGCSLPTDEDGNVLLPGFQLKGALKPFLGFLQHGLQRSRDQRHAAAKMYGDLVSLTDKNSLKPFLIKITGPLIRGVGDRLQSNVKVAILHTLSLILDKGGAKLKPFLPQLQTTFVKGIHSDSESVRSSASKALSKLVKITTRVDPLLKDLCSQISKVENAVLDEDPVSVSIRSELLRVLCDVLRCVGDKLKDKSVQLAVQMLTSLRGKYDDDIKSRQYIAEGIALAHQYVSDEELEAYLKDLLNNVDAVSTSSNSDTRHTYALEMSAVSANLKKMTSSQIRTVLREAVSSLDDDNILVQISYVRCVSNFCSVEAGLEAVKELKSSVVTSLRDLFDGTSNKELKKLCTDVLNLG